MNCRRARQLLWPPERPRIADPDVVAARQHLDLCAACRTHFAIDSVLADLRANVRETVPTRDVRERVFEAVARERSTATPGTRRRPRRRLWIMVAGLLLVSPGVIAFARSKWNVAARREPASAFVEDYIRLAVREDHILTTDAAEVRRFVLRELGVQDRLLDSPGLAVTGAEVCLLDGRRGAVIRYRTALGIVTYYLVPTAGIADRSPAPERAGNVTGAALVTWASEGIERALVGPLPLDSLLRLAARALTPTSD